jgi:hypothetical protein
MEWFPDTTFSGYRDTCPVDLLVVSNGSSSRPSLSIALRQNSTCGEYALYSAQPCSNPRRITGDTPLNPTVRGSKTTCDEKKEE